MKSNQEKLDNCPICESASLTDYMKVKDYFLSKEDFNLSQCASCHFVFTNPRPKEKYITPYYKSDKYYSHADSKKGILQALYNSARNISIKKKYKLVASKIDNKESILDFGCGTGEVLAEFKSKGWRTKGVEPDDNSRSFAISENKIDAIKPEEFYLEPNVHQYDAITLWHVLEHVHQLDRLIKKIDGILKEDGRLIIAVPNIDSFDARFYKEFWAALDVPRHLYHFNKKTIEILFSKYLFKIESTHPMKFDSYYVSLLSEEYKTGSKNVVHSLFNGLRSNLNASRKNFSYSSTIFVLKKKNNKSLF